MAIMQDKVNAAFEQYDEDGKIMPLVKAIAEIADYSVKSASAYGRFVDYVDEAGTARGLPLE